MEKKKKIKKIILSIIVSLIALISVFSCFKGKYTPEPILSPVSVLKPANSVNDNIINPTSSYDYLYANQSLSNVYIDSFIANFDFTLTINGEMVGQPADRVLSFYPILYNSNDNFGVFLHKIVYSNGNEPFYSIEILNLNSFSTISRIYASGFGWINDSGVYMFGGTFVSTNSLLFGGNTYPVGDKNNLLTNLVSPVPFLIEGDINYEQSSTGFEDVTQVESLYINTNYTNETLKTLINEKVGYNDISFSLSDENTTHTIRINNTTYECYIYINNDYIYIYNYNETQEDIYWYGYSPTGFDNNLLLFNVDLYSLSGWDNDLNFLFSETNNFGGDTPTYEEGYADGYNAGYDNGYSSGVNNVTSNPNDYNLYTYNQYQGNYTNGYNAGEEDGYNRGYLDGLDDGTNTNISFQYVESVLTLIGNFLNIEVLPGVKLSYALGVIIILTIISIIKMVVK